MQNFKVKITLFFIFFLTIEASTQQPLKLHDKNPNYLRFKGKPLLIISSSEHYGSVYNLDFDYKKHFETLSKDGLNYSRVFLGLWKMPKDNVFGLTETPFITDSDKHLSPWVMVDGKYNLDQWNQPYFDRLNDVVAEAAKRDIILEINLFSSFYMKEAWETSPFYFKNNINKLDSIDYRKSNTLYNGNALAYQEKLVRKIVSSVNKFDNIFFEIQNEPWSDNLNLQRYIKRKSNDPYTLSWQNNVEIANDVSLEWQRIMASIIVNEEKKYPKKHLISQNIGNFSPLITLPDPNISIFSIHYALPDAAIDNLKSNRVISLNETGFMLQNDTNYRREAWRFILGGGGLYNNLDYSFIPSKEDGTHQIKESTPGWGGVIFRKQMGVLKSFMQNFDFVKMKPLQNIVVLQNSNSEVSVLGELGKQYAMYFNYLNQSELTLNIPSGNYLYQWINPINGQVLEERSLNFNPKNNTIKMPNNTQELALIILRNDKK